MCSCTSTKYNSNTPCRISLSPRRPRDFVIQCAFRRMVNFHGKNAYTAVPGRGRRLIMAQRPQIQLRYAYPGGGWSLQVLYCSSVAVAIACDRVVVVGHAVAVPAERGHLCSDGFNERRSEAVYNSA